MLNFFECSRFPGPNVSDHLSRNFFVTLRSMPQNEDCL